MTGCRRRARVAPLCQQSPPHASFTSTPVASADTNGIPPKNTHVSAGSANHGGGIGPEGSLMVTKARVKTPLCELCGEPLDGELHTDHIIPRSYGGPSEAWNLRVTHASCNLHRSNNIEPVQIPLGTQFPKPDAASYAGGIPQRIFELSKEGRSGSAIARALNVSRQRIAQIKGLWNIHKSDGMVTTLRRKCRWCGYEFFPRTDHPLLCPNRKTCGKPYPLGFPSAVRRVNLYRHTCSRCGHSWETINKSPRVCQACKSYVWNKPRGS